MTTLHQRYVSALETIAKFEESIDGVVKEMRQRTTRRHSMTEWLDENEKEWNILDQMCRSRPWATQRDSPFPYPFKKATQDMREAGEELWLGETYESLQEETRKSTRKEKLGDVLTNIAPTKEYPPIARVLLFTPEFGNSESFSVDRWRELEERENYDVWTVTWQGWTDMDLMLKEVVQCLFTLADGVSTVWLGHSMGAIVMYECMKMLQKREAPCYPVAAFASGCPAPHLFSEKYRPVEAYPWLNRLRIPHDFENLNAAEIEALQRDFSMQLHSDIDEEVQSHLHYGVPLLGYCADKLAKELPKPTQGQTGSVMGDMRLMRMYGFTHEADKQILVPLVTFKSDEDDLVHGEAVDAWRDYTSAAFEVIELDDHEDTELMAAYGHGFAKHAPKSMLRKITEVVKQHLLNKDVDDPSKLPDIGPTDGPCPKEVDVVIVGAGISGVCAARAFKQQGFKPLVLEKSNAVGGIWKFYANVYSRVNTSEVGYRIIDQTGSIVRPNQDHSPRHDILRDIYSVCSEYAYGQVRCGWEVTKTQKQEDKSWIVKAKGADVEETAIRCKFVVLCVNRRIGRRRDVSFPGEQNFRGDICYGYANELTHLKFWGKRVIVVGAGAFAFENLRTALEHGAKHVTILGRRAGTTCPKWIDVIAFLRSSDERYHLVKSGNMISFEAWQKCYMDANLASPDCWKEGLLKPANHTISVSDLVFIAAHQGMADLKVGEIERFLVDGHGVQLKDGTTMDCDIVIKCTGFHLNEEVPHITGKTHMHSNGLIDHNMGYIAESLLDGGQFGSAKGMEDASDIIDADADVFLLSMAHKVEQMPKCVKELFTPKSNAFGSGFAGFIQAQSHYLAWLATEPEKQNEMVEALGKPRLDLVKTWASHGGVAAYEERKAVMARAVAPVPPPPRR